MAASMAFLTRFCMRGAELVGDGSEEVRVPELHGPPFAAESRVSECLDCQTRAMFDPPIRGPVVFRFDALALGAGDDAGAEAVGDLLAEVAVAALPGLAGVVGDAAGDVGLANTAFFHVAPWCDETPRLGAPGDLGGAFGEFGALRGDDVVAGVPKLAAEVRRELRVDRLQRLQHGPQRRRVDVEREPVAH